MSHNDPCDNYDGAFDQCCDPLGSDHADGRAIVCELRPGHRMPHESTSGLNTYRWVPKGMKMPKGSR